MAFESLRVHCPRCGGSLSMRTISAEPFYVMQCAKCGDIPLSEIEPQTKAPLTESKMTREEALQIQKMPLAHLHWDFGQPKDKGAPDPNRLFMAVGAALTSWEALEFIFASLFQTLVESKSPASHRVYGSIASARGRRDALEAAAEIFFERKKVDNEEQAAFRSLIKHFVHAASRRNEIAHGVACEVPPGGTFLIPAPYNTNKTHAFPKDDDGEWGRIRAKYRYTTEDIDLFNRRTNELFTATASYVQYLGKTYPIAPP
jgi:hypothetical protein